MHEREHQAMNLHYGCGLSFAEDWYNCDGSPTLWLQRLPIAGLAFRRFLKPYFPRGIAHGNIVTGLSLPENSCDAIYSCHVLEHLALEDGQTALRNTWKYLRRGGLFRVVVPDFEQQVATYLADGKPTALTEFLTYTFLGRKVRAKGPAGILRDLLGNSHHLWMWDFKSLSSELAEAGFQGMRRCEFGDSINPAFKAVENPSRFEWALAIECTK